MNGSNGTPSGNGRDAVRSPRLDRINARSAGGYTPEAIERGLAAVAFFAGNTRQAAAALKNQGLLIPRSTLRHWQTQRYVERYAEIYEELLPQLRHRAARQSEELVEEATEVERKLLKRVSDSAAKFRPDQAAGALRNVSVTKGINAEKSLLWRGQPTQITAHADVTDLLKTLSQRYGDVINVASDLVEAHAVEQRSEDG
jgi:hypothetical protein